MRFNFGGTWTGWGAGFGDTAALYDDSATTGRVLIGLAGREVTFWDSPEAGLQYLDLLDAGGSSIFMVSLQPDSTTYRLGHLPRFSGPDGVPVMYAQAGDAPRQRLVANDAYLYWQQDLDLVTAMQASTTTLGGRVTTTENTRTTQNTSTTSLDTRRTALDVQGRRAVAELRPTATVTLSSSTWTTVTFGAESLDVDQNTVGTTPGTGGHSTSSNTSRYTAPYAGYYLLSGMVAYAGSDLGNRYARWIINGINFTGGSTGWPVNTASSGSGVTVPARTIGVQLAVGDYVELQGYQTTGTTLATESSSASAAHMTVIYLRPL